LVATPPPSEENAGEKPRKLSVKNLIDEAVRLGAFGLLVLSKIFLMMSFSRL